MEQQTTFSISDLMNWIENQTGAFASFADLRGITHEMPHCHLSPDQHIHHCPYCEFAKVSGHLVQCIAYNKRIYARAENGVPFDAICPLGIWEWVQPVVFNKDLLGVLFLGGLRTGANLKPVGGRAYQGPDMSVMSGALKKKVRRYAHLLHDIILLIIEEWVRGGRRLSKRKPLEFYRDVTMLFIQNHYHEQVRLKDLAQQLRLHPYYLGRIIRQVTGKGFKKLLTEYRINRAKFRLLSGDQGVTQVAYLCGFGDGNYFSTVFRRLTGQTPREFVNRQNHQSPAAIRSMRK